MAVGASRPARAEVGAQPPPHPGAVPGARGGRGHTPTDGGVLAFDDARIGRASVRGARAGSLGLGGKDGVGW